MRSSTYNTKTGRRSNGRRTAAASAWSSSRWSSTNNRWNSTGSRVGAGSLVSSTTYSPSKYSNIREQLQQRAASYRTLYSECSGPGMVTCFSPTTAKSWVRFVDNGCNIYRWNNNEFVRNFGSQFSSFNNTTAFRTLRQRFGAGIKAVTRGKGNCWLVAATDSVSARPFTNYTWK